MKDQLTQLLVDRVGLDSGKASQAIDTILGFFKENPEKISSLLQNDQVEKALDNLPGGLGDKVGKLFG